MSEIKRYNIFRYQNGPAEMEQDNDGDWVDYTDCVKLEQQKAELINLLKSLWNICYIPEKYMEKGNYIEQKLTEYMEHLT